MGKSFPLDFILKTKCDFTKIGIFGQSNVGKTTLKEFLIHIPRTNKVTQSNTIYISSTNVNPVKYFGVMDGPGQSLINQVEIAVNADILLVLFDHNISNTSHLLTKERLERASFEISDLIRKCRTESKKFRSIHLILTKKDLWMKASSSEKGYLIKWFNSIVSDFEKAYLTEALHKQFHCTLNTEDNHALLKKIFV